MTLGSLCSASLIPPRRLYYTSAAEALRHISSVGAPVGVALWDTVEALGATRVNFQNLATIKLDISLTTCN